MRISCVILTYNRLAVLKQCIEAIEKNIVTPKTDYEIIVVNNCSTDGTAKYLDIIEGNFTNFKKINLNRNYGVVARNRAFEIANGKYIAQIDDDVMVQKDWDTRVLPYFDNTNVGAVGTEGAIWIGWKNEYFKDIKDGEFVDFLTGQFWVFKNEGWRYDEEYGFFWHEESDLQMRMKYEKKYKFVRCDKNVILHLELRDPNKIDWDLHNRNWERFVNKWKPFEKDLDLGGRIIK